MAMTDDDRKWEIESDARSLVDTELIKGDPKRYKAAIAKIKEENAARKKAATGN